MEYRASAVDRQSSIIELSCVIPAYNEAACLKQVLGELMATIDQWKIAYEIIVINNGSTDGSALVLAELEKSFPRLKTIHFEKNRGYGGAIVSGLAAAEGSFLVFTAADGEVPAESVLLVYDEVKRGRADLCKAKRTGRSDGWRRKIFTFGYALVVRLLFGLTTWDTNGYPVCMARATYQRLRLTKTDFTISLEMLYQAKQHGLRVTEVAVPHRPRVGGISHIRWYTAVLMLSELLRYRWKVARQRSPQTE